MRVEARPGVSTSTLPSISVLVRPREDRDSHTAQSRLCAQPVQQTETRLLTNYPAEYQLLRPSGCLASQRCDGAELVNIHTEVNNLFIIPRHCSDDWRGCFSSARTGACAPPPPDSRSRLSTTPLSSTASARSVITLSLN